jgi:LPXTG-motif cell wall-anchored protein
VNLKFYVFTENQTGAIIGGIAGGLIGVILLLLAAVFYFRAKQCKYI